MDELFVPRDDDPRSRKVGTAKNREVHLTYQGKTQNLKDWANEIGVNPATIQARHAKWRKGKLNFEDIFTPSLEVTAVGTGKKLILQQKKGRIAHAWLDKFIEHGLPRLESEFKHYMKTGEIGNAMLFIERNKSSLIPTDINVDVDAQVASVATVAVILQPQNIHQQMIDEVEYEVLDN